MTDRIARTSVITLTQDRPAWLDEALRSIEAQTDQDYEHVIVDRGSGSRTYTVLNTACERRPGQVFPLFRGRSGTNNVGYYWNYLLNYVTGKYVTILDDDNRKKPDFIAKMIAPMEADPEVEAVSCGWTPINAAGARSGDDRHWNLQTSIPRLWRSNTIDSNALMFRHSILHRIGVFDETLTTNEDWHFVIRLVRRCKMVHLEDCLLDYREHDHARSRRAVELGAHANWHRIRTEMFSKQEWREAISLPEV